MSVSSLLTSVLLLFSLLNVTAYAQRRRAPAGGRIAIVIDERLAALRDSPSLSGILIRRLGRGRLVAIRSERRTPDGITFSRVNLTSRTSGWIQRDALAVPNLKSDEERVLRLIRAAEDFDRIARARIFLDEFPRAVLRPAALFLLGEAADAAAEKLTRDATRRLKAEEIAAGDAPEFSYYLNYVGLDRYNRQGIRFIFDREQKRFRYSGAAWKELLRRYPRSAEAAEARKRIDR